MLEGSWSTLIVDKVPTQDGNKEALEGDMDLDKKIIKPGDLNGLYKKDLILSINTGSVMGKVTFRLMRNAKSPDFPMGNCNIAWD